MDIKNENYKNLLISLNDSHNNNAFLMGIVASTLATIGLATNSQTTLIGSMLLSPIGALICKTILYSFLTQNGVKLNVKYQRWFLQIVMVLVITLIISFCLGKLFSVLKNPFTKEPLTKDWPTNEMRERAKPINAIYMIIIALMCGIALPISLINNSGTKLVAIGISTALIPPISNIGLSLSMDKNKYKDYQKQAIITGSLIFLINCILLWVPSKFILPEISKETNIFKFIENVFIFPSIIFKYKKYNEFMVIKKNKDRYLNYKEFTDFIKKKNNKLTNSQVNTMFKKTDKNKNKFISLKEYIDL